MNNLKPKYIIMKANELRIGNYVLGISNTPEIIELITKYEVDTDVHDALPINQIEPIPLTEDWLLKFGFEKDSQINLYRVKNESGTIVYYPNNSVEKAKINFMVINACIMINTINYVHQLQNLYHALTNQELTCNLEK